MNPNDDKNQMNQMAAQTALKQKEEEAYQKRLEEKRAARARVSAVGIDNPFDIPESYKDPRFHYMIVNDSPGRVNMFRARGYELVTDASLAGYLNQKAGDPIKFATGMHDPAWAYLMRIEKELFEEDMEAQRRDSDAKMQALGIAPKDLEFAQDAQVSGVNLQKQPKVITE
ncbi:MAG: hypothetical protein J6U92_07775 [Clostridia bacterium]|nr:hypothetical protein [Clostridia bacterium]